MKKLFCCLVIVLIFSMLGSETIFSAIPDFFSNLFGEKQKKTHDSWLLYDYSVTGRPSTIKWQGLPALGFATPGGDIANIVLEEIMGNGSNPTVSLENLFCHELETYDYLTVDFNGIYWDNDDEILSRIQGYKFEVVKNLTQDVELDILGIQVPEGTSIPLTSFKPNTTEYMPNWTCYYPNETQEWNDALGNSISNIYYVQTQNWTMQRTMAKPSAPWVDVMNKEFTLSRGDMVIIKCFSDEDFVWNTGTTSVPLAPAKSTAFVYEEEFDYIPVYVEFDEEDAPTEVAVLADGVCQGAAVVEDGEAQVCAYITDNSGETLELEYYYGERTANKTVKELKVYNADADCFVNKPIEINPNEAYYQISLRNEQESVEEIPIKTSLKNYPNPFNPTTNISYSVPTETNVKLEIYNVRGQLVKTIVNGTSPAGEYKVTWHGVDNQGQKVGSGIYFSSLKTGKEVLNKKMVLLK